MSSRRVTDAIAQQAKTASSEKEMVMRDVQKMIADADAMLAAIDDELAVLGVAKPPRPFPGVSIERRGLTARIELNRARGSLANVMRLIPPMSQSERCES